MNYPLIEVAKIAFAAKPIAYQGVRKIINGLTWDAGPIFYNDKNRLGWSDLGYGPNKFKQLQRNYVNEEEFARVRAVLDRRKDQSFTSVALSLRGKSKGNRSMGHCLLSVVVTRTKREERVEVQYRSTELTLKFGGDLVFLPWVFDQLGVQLSSPVTFRFANCFLSGVYFGYLLSFHPKPADFLRWMFECDSKFMSNASRYFLRSLMKENQFFPYSPENVAHRFTWGGPLRPKIGVLRELLTNLHGGEDAIDWARVHHKKGVYVPRGKRAAAREIEGEDE